MITDMKGKAIVTMLLAGLPWLAMAQSTDDLYYLPKKEAKKEVKTTVSPVHRTDVQPVTRSQSSETVVLRSPASTVVVKDVAGKVRDIDAYNRRYTSRDNRFSMQNDTLYVEEKPYSERGEWVNGFEGSQSDYEYAMRIVRFRSPRYAIPVSSPLYWDIVYGGAAFPSWEWNVFDDGFYAYVFPSSSNPLWWDWRFNWSLAGPSWGWRSSWYYRNWYAPYWSTAWYGGWYGGYWGGYWGGWHGYYPHYPHYVGWHGHGHGHYAPRYSYNSRRGDAGWPVRGTSGRTVGSFRSAETYRPSGQNGFTRQSYDRNGRSGGRVVTSRDNLNSVRPSGTAGTRNTGTYTRSPQVGQGESNYNRPSSTRSGSYRNSGAYQRLQGGSSAAPVRNSSEGTSRSTFNRENASPSRSSNSFGSFRSSGSSSGSSSRSVGTGSSSGGGGGARRR